jgi:hypothetical protein
VSGRCALAPAHCTCEEWAGVVTIAVILVQIILRHVASRVRLQPQVIAYDLCPVRVACNVEWAVDTPVVAIESFVRAQRTRTGFAFCCNVDAGGDVRFDGGFGESGKEESRQDKR